MLEKPIVIDIFCGLGGWSQAFIAEGYQAIGYDIEAHDYGDGGYPGTLVLADVTTLHGSQFKDAAIIVASPPCQEFSYMAMPWSKAKAKQAAIEADTTGEAKRKLTFLFDTCFRLQREAIEAAGHYIPMIVENVRGAQKWVGKSAWNYGSFHLWGDVPALMPIAKHFKSPGNNWSEWKGWDGTEENKPASKRLWGDGVKSDGSGWTDKGSLISHNRLVSNQGIKDPNQNWSRFAKSGEKSPHWKMGGLKGVPHKPGGHWTNAAEHKICTCPTECDCQNCEPQNPEDVALCSQKCPIHNLNPRPALDCKIHGELSEGIKIPGNNSPRRWEDRTIKRLGDATTAKVRETMQDESGTKQGGDWFGAGCDMSISRLYSSKSKQRKKAAAEIAKIPFPLAQHIARVYKPR